MTPSEPSEFRAMDALSVVFVALFLIVGLALSLPPDYHALAVAALPLSVFGGAWLRRKSGAVLFRPGRVTPEGLFWTGVGSAGLFLLLMGVMPFVMRYLPDYTSELERQEQEIRALPGALAVALVAILVPFFEESFFRGALLRGFRASWGTVAGIVASSALFAVVHQIPPRMIATFILGCWFGALFVRSGGLGLPVLAHAVNNGLVLFLFARDVPFLPSWVAAPGAAALALASWRLFRSVQGSAAPAAS